MKKFSVCRATHIVGYFNALRNIGVPIDQKLAQSGLPVWIEDMPNAYVCQSLALNLLGSCCIGFSPMELGFRTAENLTFDALEASLSEALQSAPTGFERIELLSKHVAIEDSALSIGMVREGSNIRVNCDFGYMKRHPFICLREWPVLLGLTKIIRDIVGPNWHPDELTFMSSDKIPDAAMRGLFGARLLAEQPRTSLLVDAAILNKTAAPKWDSGHSIASGHGNSITSRPNKTPWNLPDVIRSVVRPYLGEGHPELAHTAEVFGVSGRTLQRKLHRTGSCYSEIVQEARFEVAAEMLTDPKAKIIDIALMAGYDNPQNFSRAFRHFTGFSPSRYRSTLTA